MNTRSKLILCLVAVKKLLRKAYIHVLGSNFLPLKEILQYVPILYAHSFL